MSRRGFFGAIVGAVTAAALPWTPAAAPAPQMFEGLAGLVADGGTVGGINRATFAFWHKRQLDGWPYDEAALRRAYNECSRGPMK